jgi:thiol-disulfide isomerase/thioredoxin
MVIPSKKPGSRERRSFQLVVIALALGVLAGFAVLPRALDVKSEAVGKKAPDFELPVLHGGEGRKTLKLSELRGHAVLLDFWATWCGPCRAETPTIDRLARRLKRRGVRVVGVNVNDRPAAAKAFAKQLGLSYPIVADLDGKVGASFGVQNLPTIVVIDRQGRIAAVRTGLTDAGTLETLLLAAQK